MRKGNESKEEVKRRERGELMVGEGEGRERQRRKQNKKKEGERRRDVEKEKQRVERRGREIQSRIKVAF